MKVNVLVLFLAATTSVATFAQNIAESGGAGNNAQDKSSVERNEFVKALITNFENSKEVKGEVEKNCPKPQKVSGPKIVSAISNDDYWVWTPYMVIQEYDCGAFGNPVRDSYQSNRKAVAAIIFGNLIRGDSDDPFKTNYIPNLLPAVPVDLEKLTISAALKSGTLNRH